jgi:hypothetical protein
VRPYATNDASYNITFNHLQDTSKLAGVAINQSGKPSSTACTAHAGLGGIKVTSSATGSSYATGITVSVWRAL